MELPCQAFHRLLHEGVEPCAVQLGHLCGPVADELAYDGGSTPEMRRRVSAVRRRSWVASGGCQLARTAQALVEPRWKWGRQDAEGRRRPPPCPRGCGASWCRAVPSGPPAGADHLAPRAWGRATRARRPPPGRRRGRRTWDESTRRAGLPEISSQRTRRSSAVLSPASACRRRLGEAPRRPAGAGRPSRVRRRPPRCASRPTR